MRKENILIVHNYYQIPGGEDTVVANEKEMLIKNGHNVSFYSRSNVEIKEMGILRKLILPLSSIFSIKTFKDIKKIIKDNNIDIVHVHNTLSLISPSVYYAALVSKVPIVQTVHNFRLICPAATLYYKKNICEECINKNLNSSIKRKCYHDSFIQTIVSAMILKINRCLGIYNKINYICLTEFNKRKLLSINSKECKVFNEKRIFIKPNFIKEVSNLTNIEKKNQFVFLGRLDELKGIKILLEHWSKIKNYKLIICGTGPCKEWCEEYIKLNNMNNVELKGFLEKEEVNKVIAESIALILPTLWYEGFPMTILESWAYSTPVIGSNIGNVGNIIDNEINGVKFNVFDFNELELAINTVINIKFNDKLLDIKYKEAENYKILKKIYEICQGD